MWCGEGLSERNINLIQQLDILVNTLGLPLICYGDFNIDSNTLAESGFLDKLHVQVLAPDSSTIASSHSIIDYVLISRSIFGIVKSFKIDSAVAFAPHFGLDLICHTRPLEVKGRVLCIPKALPLESFNKKWAELDEAQQDRAYRGASIMAYNRLQHHKLKTGIAILGSPMDVLDKDPKYQGSVRTSAITQGEELAHIALAAELLVLSIDEIPQKDWNKYIGRSQYPKFQIKSLCKPNSIEPLENILDLRFWSKVRGLVSQCKLENHVEKKITFATESINALADINEHGNKFDTLTCNYIDNNNEPAAVTYNQFLMLIVSNASILTNCNAILAFSSFITHRICDQVIADSAKAWRNYIKEQLYKGGGKLFKYIAKEDKAFANVHFIDEKGVSMPPETFLDKQNKKWQIPWSLDPEQTVVLVACLEQVRIDTLEDFASSPRLFNVDTLDLGLHRYKKNSLGGDVWSATELRALPKVCRQEIADNIQQAFIHLSWPHQQLVSLNMCLGKPNGGYRTICKSPMIYRMAMRGLKGIRQWKIEHTQKYDTAKTHSSALYAALIRGLKAEVATRLNKIPAAIFNDFHHFFDHLDIVELILAAIKCELPMDLLVMALPQHLAPRIILAQGFCGDPIQITRSILQGCICSVGFTRA